MACGVRVRVSVFLWAACSVCVSACVCAWPDSAAERPGSRARAGAARLSTLLILSRRAFAACGWGVGGRSPGSAAVPRAHFDFPLVVLGRVSKIFIQDICNTRPITRPFYLSSGKRLCRLVTVRRAESLLWVANVILRILVVHGRAAAGSSASEAEREDVLALGGGVARREWRRWASVGCKPSRQCVTCRSPS